MLLALRLGTAKVDITPRHPVPLAGYAARQGTFSRVADPIYLRAMLFEQTDLTGGRERILLVSADLIWWGSERMPGIHQAIKERWQVPPHHVVLNATHAHTAPQTSARFVPALGSADRQYLEELEAQLFEAIDQAASNLEEVVAERGYGTCDIGANRRLLVGGTVTGDHNPCGPVDREVTVIRFRTARNVTKALLVHYTCHPTTTIWNNVSAEYPGVAMSHLEQELGNGALAAFFQGCCGDVRPALERGGRFFYGEAREIEALGLRLARAVLDVLDEAMERLVPCEIRGRTVQVDLSFQQLPAPAELVALREQPGVWGEWSRLLLLEPERLRPSIPLRLTFVEVASGLGLLAMDGEVTVEYGLWIKQRFGNAVLSLGYSNGMIGYVPTAAQVVEGGYEARDSCPYFGLPAPFSTTIEDRIKNAIVGLVEGGA